MPGVAAMLTVSMFFFVGADIANMRECEGDDLAGIRRIGEDFLIAGHGSVEAHLTGCMAAGAETEAFEHGAVGEDQDGSRSLFLPTGAWL